MMRIGHRKEIRKLTFPALALRRSEYVSFIISLRWPIHIISPIDKTKSSPKTQHLSFFRNSPPPFPPRYRWTATCINKNCTWSGFPCSWYEFDLQKRKKKIKRVRTTRWAILVKWFKWHYVQAEWKIKGGFCWPLTKGAYRHLTAFSYCKRDESIHTARRWFLFLFSSCPWLY